MRSVFPQRIHGAPLVALLILLVTSACDRPPTAGSPSSSPAAQTIPLTNMVLIKAGSFVRLQQVVTITRDFWLGKYEVSQAEYAALMGTNPSHFQESGMDCPVEKVSHDDATRFCALLTQREREAGRLHPGLEYRLPSEAEWEYACRAGTTNLYSFGDDTSVADHYAWTAENSDARTHPAGQKQPNPWGLYDMHGNVWEWTQDWFAQYPPTAAIDPVGPPAGKFKVFRGGGWNNEIEFARSANRFMMVPGNGIFFVGFRVALGPELQQSMGPATR